nr:hypothetical protein [uncultured Methanoregula sp.]
MTLCIIVQQIPDFIGKTTPALRAHRFVSAGAQEIRIEIRFSAGDRSQRLNPWDRTGTFALPEKILYLPPENIFKDLRCLILKGPIRNYSGDSLSLCNSFDCFMAKYLAAAAGIAGRVIPRGFLWGPRKLIPQ